MIFRLAEGGLGAALYLTGITVSRPTLVAATLFAIGSTFFCRLLLRGRMLPRGLAWTGVIASIVLVVGLPLQLGGLLGPPFTMLIWMPMLAFEVQAVCGCWRKASCESPCPPVLSQLASGVDTPSLNPSRSLNWNIRAPHGRSAGSSSSVPPAAVIRFAAASTSAAPATLIWR